MSGMKDLEDRVANAEDTLGVLSDASTKDSGFLSVTTHSAGYCAMDETSDFEVFINNKAALSEVKAVTGSGTEEQAPARGINAALIDIDGEAVTRRWRFDTHKSARGDAFLQRISASFSPLSPI